eukprot:TRINITY_DN3565_c0_g1_i1.p1 TRINITY_DN3565_c0_g1~~TRINITY_DN3565_c0_g1_i1.p1  ORF type:complete len:680 (-),score=56.12 TRINITY_DN3565_c0_g1_i1:208-2247(-)
MEKSKPNSKFALSPSFVAQYQALPAKFGFPGLGEIVYRRSYSRLKADTKSHEKWYETVERVVNGTFEMQRLHCLESGLEFDYEEAQKDAAKMYDKIFNFKFLPPGRGLWAMGTALTESKRCYTALNNCAFVSTFCPPGYNFVEPFLFLLDSTMLGVGVGFDTKGAGQVIIRKPTEPNKIVKVEDSREGWVVSLKILLEGYFEGKEGVSFDYSGIRPKGTPLETFGGVSSGSDPLKLMHDTIREVLSREVGKQITSRTIVDLMNIIGAGVMGIRPSAEIAFGDRNDKTFASLKDYEKFPERAAYGWVSNNSIIAEVGMDYQEYMSSIAKSGEPGFCWLENMRAYGRMCEEPNYKDHHAAGGPPCLEQTLESYEMCCLVETFPYNNSSYQEFEETLKYAFLYAKTVTLGKAHWERTSAVISRNRRIGCSLSGIAQFVDLRGRSVLAEWCQKGYSFLKAFDLKLSSKWHINPSIKITCVKPSGTVSLLAGATPGIHYPESRYYIRRVRFPECGNLYEYIKASGYKVEYDVRDKNKQTLVVEIPVCVGEGVRTIKEVTMWEQADLVVMLQKCWADNQVSCTIKFNPDKETCSIPKLLEIYQHKLKAICFFPHQEEELKKVYTQMPYEEISKEKYKELKAKVKPISMHEGVDKYDPAAERFCDNDKCQAGFQWPIVINLLFLIT